MPLPKAKTPKSNDINSYTYLIYGEPKVGKTTFASKYPNALFIATEAGHKFVEVYQTNPKSWTDIKKTARELLTEEHDYKTVVIDTADNMVMMVARSVCNQMNLQHEADADFGKAYSRIKQEIMDVVSALTRHGLGVVFISHVDMRETTMHQNVSDGKGGHRLTEVKSKMIDATLSGSAKKIIRGLCDMIFYCYIDDNSKRWIRTKQTESIMAGDRSGKLPAVMPLDYEKFENELKKQIEE